MTVLKNTLSGMISGRDKQRLLKVRFCVLMPTHGNVNWCPVSGVAGFLVLQGVGESPSGPTTGRAAGVGAA